MRTHRIVAMELVMSMAMLSGSSIAPAGAQRLRAGTTMDVRLETNISTDDTHPGDSWSGTVTRDVYSRGQVGIPAGSQVSGEVTNSGEGDHHTPPSPDL